MGNASLQLHDDGRVVEPVLELAQFVGGIENVGKPEVGDDDVAVPVQQQILELEVAMHDSLLVQISNARHELREQPTRRRILEVSVRQDVVEELAARRILENDSDVAVGLDAFVKADDVGVRQCLQDGDFAVYLGNAGGMGRNRVSTNEFDCDLTDGLSSCIGPRPRGVTIDTKNT